MGGDAPENVSEPSLGVDVVELGGGDEGVDGGCSLATAVGATETPCFSSEGSSP